MQYIPPLIFSSLGLVDPAVTAILSWAIGVESLPSMFSWIGGFVVMAGVGIISYGEHVRTHNEDKSHDHHKDHNHHKDNNDDDEEEEGMFVNLEMSMVTGNGNSAYMSLPSVNTDENAHAS